MNATEARKLTEEAKSLQGEAMRQVTQEVLDAICQAAKAGYQSVDIVAPGATNPIVRDRLKFLGYEVKYHSNQIDGNYLTVSW